MGRLVDAALRFPGLVLALALGLLGVGLYCYTQLDVEAYPNPVAPMIEVITQPQGLSAEEVERYVTIPLEIGLAGMLDREHVRSQSLFGLSDVKCYFTWAPSEVYGRRRSKNCMYATSTLSCPSSRTTGSRARQPATSTGP